MSEVVIVAIGRTPIGRAVKGSLIEQRPENVADKYGITREEMDQYALQSQMRAVLARKDGIFAREIIPVPLLSGGGQGMAMIIERLS